MMNFRNVMYCALIIGSALILTNILSPKNKHRICVVRNTNDEVIYLERNHKVINIESYGPDYSKITYR